MQIGAGNGLAMWLMTGLAVDGVVGGIHGHWSRADEALQGGNAGNLTDETVGGVASHAGLLPRAGGIARRNRVSGVAPFQALHVVRGFGVALAASTRGEGLRDQQGIPAGSDMCAARPMAVLALDVGNILQCRRHGGKVTGLQNGGSGPPKLRHDVVESAVEGSIVGVVAYRVASPACTGVWIRNAVHDRALAIDAGREDLRVECCGP